MFFLFILLTERGGGEGGGGGGGRIRNRLMLSISIRQSPENGLPYLFNEEVMGGWAGGGALQCQDCHDTILQQLAWLPTPNTYKAKQGHVRLQ